MARKRHTGEEIIGKLSAVYAAAPGPGLGRDGPADRTRHRVGECLQAVRVPAYHLTDVRRRVAGEPQASGAALAAGGAEGAEATTEAEPTVVQRLLVRAATGGVP